MPTWTPAQVKRMRRYMASNPYGTLGPSPARVATINRITPPTPPPQITNPGGASPIYNTKPIYREPNWAALIAGDPEMIGAEAEMESLNRMDRASLRDSIRRAVVESGLDVGLDEDIDEGTLAAARANQFSSAADIANQLRRNTAQSDAELAARGALYSGQFTENRSQLQKGADLARNTLQANLLSGIESGRAGYTSAVAGRHSNLRNLRAQIASRLAQNPGLFFGGYEDAPPGAYVGGSAPKGDWAPPREVGYDRSITQPIYEQQTPVGPIVYAGGNNPRRPMLGVGGTPKVNRPGWGGYRPF